MSHLPPLVSVVETRRLLGDISHSKIYDLFARHELQRVKIDRRTFVTSQSISEYLTHIVQACDDAGGAAVATDGIEPARSAR